MAGRRKKRNRFDFLTKKFPKRMQKKLVMLFMAVILAFVVLIGRITYINASKGSGYTKIVLDQQAYDSRVIPYKRGDIVDRKDVYKRQMLYSTSAYSAQADFNNDMFYFSKQAFVGVVSFGVMLLVSRIDYHFYGAFSFEIFVFAMITVSYTHLSMYLQPLHQKHSDNNCRSIR